MRPRIEVSSFSPLSIDGGALKREGSAVCVTVENYLRPTGIGSCVSVSVLRAPCTFCTSSLFFYPLTWQEARGFGISAERNAGFLFDGTANVRFCVSFFLPSTFCYSCEPAGNSDKDSPDISCRDAERNLPDVDPTRSDALFARFRTILLRSAYKQCRLLRLTIMRISFLFSIRWYILVVFPSIHFS